jgi:hypothetical protein
MPVIFRARLSLTHRAVQRGAVLFITLIMLVAMTLAAIALMRSVDTATLIAGNLAFSKSAAYSGNTAIETAITWLANNNVGNTLGNSVDHQYVAHQQDPDFATQETWDHFWINTLKPANPNYIVSLGTDGAGNKAFYIIHRLCDHDDSAPPVNCVPPPPTDGTGGSMGAGAVALKLSTQRYYRITVRVEGPKNTVSYVQAFVRF